VNLVRTVAALTRALHPRERQSPIGFVPTMGALHAGHASLFRQARAESRTVVASIFVNPKQFNDPSDLARYPRCEDADVRVAVDAGVDLLFVPPASEIYPVDLATKVSVAGPALGWEGAQRPGHFDGVALVCLKLFNIVRADYVYFGQKDAQQVAVIQQLVRDMNLALDLRIGPTVRDTDGVALSSRNVRLSPSERMLAQSIPRALRRAGAAHVRGEDPRAAALGALAGLDVEYVDVASFHGERTLVVAVRIGTVRLIDNVPLDDPGRAGLGSGETHDD
jgi:pantoate--beta-alanine ligase